MELLVVIHLLIASFSTVAAYLMADGDDFQLRPRWYHLAILGLVSFITVFFLIATS